MQRSLMHGFQLSASFVYQSGSESERLKSDLLLQGIEEMQREFQTRDSTPRGLDSKLFAHRVGRQICLSVIVALTSCPEC
jgi:hypothetical protein